MRFIEARSKHIVESKIIHNLLDLKHVESINTEDVPTLAIGGSGGGYRATFGFMTSLEALQKQGALNAAHWLAGVSGSCWTIASIYTVGNLKVNKVVKHCKSVAQEGFHPMSRQALDAVARSSKGVYFLLAPLLSKVKSGVVGIGVMVSGIVVLCSLNSRSSHLRMTSYDQDMYATLTTSYQLLSRSPHARPRLSRSTFQFSKMWDRMRLSEGLAPLPIFTAVRVRHTERDSSAIASIPPSPPKRQETQQDDEQPFVLSNLDRESEAVKARQKVFSDKKGVLDYQWWEMNPLEVGSSDEGAWVPSWSYGRSFDRGSSTSNAPEISLSLLLGQATSAPAGPLTGYISTLLATLPKGTVMSFLLSKINTFVQQKRWEKRWGNPIRGADEPNPLYGIGDRDKESRVNTQWERKKRIKLMDSGLSNNLPNRE